MSLPHSFHQRKASFLGPWVPIIAFDLFALCCILSCFHWLACLYLPRLNILLSLPLFIANSHEANVVTHSLDPLSAAQRAGTLFSWFPPVLESREDDENCPWYRETSNLGSGDSAACPSQWEEKSIHREQVNLIEDGICLSHQKFVSLYLPHLVLFIKGCSVCLWICDSVSGTTAIDSRQILIILSPSRFYHKAGNWSMNYFTTHGTHKSA